MRSGIAFFFLAIISNHALAKGIPNFAKVTDGIYRGGLPGTDGFAQLKKLGIKTVLNLQAVEKIIEQEEKDAAANGMNFVSIPMSSSPFVRPSVRKLQKILDVITDERNQPVYVHCRAGKDRTGIAIGLFRVLYQGMNTDKAYKEMKKYGYHFYYNFGFNCAFSEATGQNVAKACDLFRPQD